MNFDMAAEMADMDSIKVETVIVNDASAPKGNEKKEGGLPDCSTVTKLPERKLRRVRACRKSRKQ